MHGAGNDYVYVDLFAERVDDAPALARAVSDRRRGIGADGLILLCPSERADVAMVMYNADGSRAEMCGNGIRCLARLAMDAGRAAGNPIRVETDSGIRTVELTDGGARVEMGVPDVQRIGHEMEVSGARLSVTCISMGNPHAVVFVGDVEATDVAGLGRALETDPLFPEGTNVEFVEVVDSGRVRQRTWERGSGETLACGTGACAACVAGVVTGRTDGRVRNELRGGELLLEWEGEGSSVHMTGPVAKVFEGDWGGRGV